MPFPNARSLLHRYLLGESADEEKRVVEQRSLVDEDYGERLWEAEPELMAEYVSGHLTLDKRERFESHFLDSEERIKKLAFATSLYEGAKNGAARLRNPDDHLRRYLLGKLSPAEELKVEQIMITDDYKKRMETAEHRLITDYVCDNLTEAEREMFRSHFLRFDGMEEKLRFAEIVYGYYECVQWLEAHGDSSAKRFDRLWRWLAGRWAWI